MASNFVSRMIYLVDYKYIQLKYKWQIGNTRGTSHWEAGPLSQEGLDGGPLGKLVVRVKRRVQI